MIMKAVVQHPLLIAATLFMLSGCQNDGYLGDMFGTWRVDSFTKNGELVEDENVSLTTFSFQNNVVNVVLLTDEYHGAYSRFGSWKQLEGQFTLDFTHHDDNNPQGTGTYQAPEWLEMTSEEPMVMSYSSKESKRMTWIWRSAEGNTYVYKLSKTW